jgi:hypothetical protein
LDAAREVYVGGYVRRGTGRERRAADTLGHIEGILEHSIGLLVVPG